MPEPPIDERPRSEVSDPDWRPEDEEGATGRGLVWLILAVIAVAAFVAALWMLKPWS